MIWKQFVLRKKKVEPKPELLIKDIFDCELRIIDENEQNENDQKTVIPETNQIFKGKKLN